MKTEYSGAEIKELFGIQSDTLNGFGLTARYSESTGGYYYQHKQVLHAWLKYKTKKGATLKTKDGKEMTRETAETLLTIEKLKNLQLKNELVLGNQAPIEYMNNVLTHAASGIRSRLESIPLNIKIKYPEVPVPLLREIDREIIAARNEMATLKIDWDLAKE